MKLIFLTLAVLGVVYCADEISVTDFKTGVLAKDQTVTDENVKTVAVFSKASSVLTAQAAQRLYVSFNIQKKTDGSKITPQQVFLVLEHSSGKDVSLVVDPQANGKQYVYDSLLRTAAKHFNDLSGKFKASLVIGGSNVKTAINWHFADFDLTVPTTPVVIPKSQQINYEKLPGIEHQFRQPEKRPASFISDFFTIVCLSPLVVLVGAWLKIGINFDNAPVSLWVPIFHVGLAGILGLYFVFWLQLDMFATLKYLAILGSVTFFAGNRVLRSLSASKSKTE